MIKMLHTKKGFTLIELLIVIAIIAILAAIAIPQFAAYRTRGFNASTESDLRNARTAEEALFADWRFYGRTQAILVGIMLPGGGGYGVGTDTRGPMSSATPLFAGALLTTFDGAGVAQGVGIGIGANNEVHVDTDATGATYSVISKNLQGNRVFGAELESSGLLFRENVAWIGQWLAATGVGVPGTTTGADFIAPWANM